MCFSESFQNSCLYFADSPILCFANSIVELPPEKLELAQQQRTAHQLKIALFHTVFDFTINRNVFNSLPMTDDQIKHATCEDMFCPRNELSSEPGARCIYSDDGVHGNLEIDLKEENLLFLDMSAREIGYAHECENTTEFIDDEWELGSAIRQYHRGVIDYSATKGCIMLCPLVLPTVEEVESCRINQTLLFDTQCLNNGTLCPNCHRLDIKAPFDEMPLPSPSVRHYAKQAGLDTSNIPAGRLWGTRPAESEELFFIIDPHHEQAPYLAETYLVYKDSFDKIQPRSFYQWSLRGSIYFAITALSTIGYGNFAPSTNTSKLLLIFFSIPMICVFGYSLSRVAVLLTLLVSKVQRTISHAAEDIPAKGEHTVHTRAQFLRQYVSAHSTDVAKGISKEELCSVLLELYVSEGWQTSSLTKATKRSLTKDIEHATRDVFTNSASEDAPDTVDMMDAVAMVHTVAEHWRAVQRSEDEERRIRYSLFLALGITLLSALFFWASDQQDMTFVDALYFCTMTSTSIGFGDFTPQIHTNLWILAYWICYVFLSMGLFAVVAQGAPQSLTSRMPLFKKQEHSRGVVQAAAPLDPWLERLASDLADGIGRLSGDLAMGSASASSDDGSSLAATPIAILGSTSASSV
jgi:hypothetical protein